MIEPGASVGDYRIERLLGRGGMGVVYEAVQPALERRVALKVLRPELVQDAEFIERFRREGRLQASIEHPHVLDVYEVGEWEGGLFLAMRLVQGRTLLQLLRQGELDAERALRLLAQVAEALDAAHEAGLVHRDVKPQNVLVAEDDHAFLSDFGLTRLGTETTVSARPMLGTTAYIAPEVVRGAPPTPASDRYAFAAALFHCLTGDVPFPRGSDAAVLYAHATEPPPSAHERRPELPAQLDPIFAAALAKEPGDRPAGARELVAGVASALGPNSIAALGPPEPAGRHEPTPATLPSPPAGALRGPARGRRLAVVAGTALAAAVLGAGAVALLDDSDPEPEVPVPPVAPRAQVLGSDLSIPDRAVDCESRLPTSRSRPCSIVQSSLPGAQLLAPADGVIVGWTVRGAKGELAIDVIRPRGEDTTRVAKSQWELAGNPGPHRFATRLPIEAGDRIGLELGPGSAIGVSETDGATTQRWFAPEGGGYGNADRAEGTGFDYEVALRAELAPGARVGLPAHVTGAEAAAAREGKVRERAELEVSKPAATLKVELVEVGERVALDVLRDGRRGLRVFMPGLRAGGPALGLKTYEYSGESFGEADVWWVNPGSGRLVFRFFIVSHRHIEFWG